MNKVYKTIEISEETRGLLNKFCEEYGVSEEEAIQKAYNRMKGHSKVKYNWPNHWKRGGKAKISAEQRSGIVQSLSANIPVADIAEKYKVSRQTVYTIRRKVNKHE